MNRFLFACVLWAVGLLGAFAQKVHPGYADGQLYVRLRHFTHPKTGEVFLPRKNFSAENLPFELENPGRYKIKSVQRAFQVDASPELNATLLLEFENIYLAEELIREIEQSRFVTFAEKVPYMTRFLDPNDPRFNTQWHLGRINAATAWNYFSTGSNIVIAIVDDGIERTHPDIEPNLWRNSGEIAGNSIDDDGNGFVDDVNGWNLVNSNGMIDPNSESEDHGTHVAGIASGATNNGVGIASIGFSCKLMGVRIADNTSFPASIAYNGVLYAANMGAHIINMSWGSSAASETGQSVVEFALSKDCIMVAAAGNEGSSSKFYPAAFDGVISVASTTASDAKSPFSNFGSWIKISAPGSSILSTIPFGRYGSLSGTSMASPMVAGLLGLMKSLNPGMPNSQIINCLYSSADNIDPVNPDFIGSLGAGRINAERAMACVAANLTLPPIAEFTASATTVPAGSPINFRDLSAFTPTSWSWSFPGSNRPTSNLRNPSGIVYSTPGTYSVSLTVTNANGSNTLTKTNYITVTPPLSCTRVNLPIPSSWKETVYVFDGEQGFVNGVNANGHRQKAMFFDLSGTNNTHLTNFFVKFSHANGISLSKVVRFRVYDGSLGPNNRPGTELFSTTRTLAQIRANVLANTNTNIDITNNLALPVSKRFFLAVDISELTWGEDSINIYSNEVSPTPGTNLVWEQRENGQWLRYDVSHSVTGLSLFMHPHLTATPTSMVINPKNPSVCSGGRVDFNSTGSVSTSGAALNWILPGTNPGQGTGSTFSAFYNATGNFKAYLAAVGACDEVRVDSTVVAVAAAPVLSISVSKNPICAGETATLTATGATSYTWSPATGLNTTTGATVQANPLNTVVYTINGLTGTCSSTSILELEVRGTSASVSLQASQINITQPTSITFTASPLNGGSAPNFNFRVNGNSVQSGPVNSLVRVVNVNDRVTCEMTSTEPCVAEKTVVSNEIVMGNPSLPVLLTRFTGKKQINANLLEWTTGTEINSDVFVLERGNNGVTFSEIGRIKAAGNSNIPRDYSLPDPKFEAGKNYYRLKMIDLDGTFRYSRIVLIDNSAANLTTALWPNPARPDSESLLKLNGLPVGKISISLIGASGSALKNFNLKSDDGNLQVRLAAQSLSSGVYLLVIKDENGNILDKVKWAIIR